MRGSRRSFWLWSRPDRIVASRGGIRGQNPQRFETWRSASRKSDEIRIRDQRENGEGTWRDGSIDDPGARKQGNRMKRDCEQHRGGYCHLEAGETRRFTRRALLCSFGAMALAMPLASLAQKGRVPRRLGVLLVLLSPDGKEARAFKQGLL